MGDVLNPNHAVVKLMENQWHKFVGLLIHKQGLKEVVISLEDIEGFMTAVHHNIAIEERSDGIHLYLLDDATAMALARREGGLPI